MNERMTDERLAEIEAEWSDPAYKHPDNITWDVRHILELLQALKTEREYAAELEAEAESDVDIIKRQTKRIVALRATIARVEALPDKWLGLVTDNPDLIAENRNHVLRYCTDELEAALKVAK